jgi:ATP-dependent Clp protease protease subunit
MNNILYLADNEDDTVDSIIKSILEINQEDQGTASPRPIHLYVNSYGGEVYLFLGLIDIINASKTPVYTYALGASMSSALLVILAGHKRFAYKHSTFMYHQISTGEWGTTKHLEEDLVESKRLQKIIDSIILTKTKITKRQLTSIYNNKKDWYMNSEDALKYQIIDQII